MLYKFECVEQDQIFQTCTCTGCMDAWMPVTWPSARPPFFHSNCCSIAWKETCCCSRSSITESWRMGFPTSLGGFGNRVNLRSLNPALFVKSVTWTKYQLKIDCMPLCHIKVKPKWDPIFFGIFFRLSFGIFFRISVLGVEAGRKEGRKQRRKKGRKKWRKEGRKEGSNEGRKEEREEGRKEEMKKERKKGRKEGRKEGSNEGRKEETEEEREEEREEGRKEGRNEEGEEERKEGRKCGTLSGSHSIWGGGAAPSPPTPLQLF